MGSLPAGCRDLFPRVRRGAGCVFTGEQMERVLAECGVTHVVWLPDSAMGPWEAALERSSRLRLVRVCREGEAWVLAAGLLVGGARPLVMMQCTGLFESGDALRNAAFDLQLPVFGLIGLRNWLAPNSPDSARRFALPLVEAWGLPYVLLERPADQSRLAEHYRWCWREGRPGLALLAEGKG